MKRVFVLAALAAALCSTGCNSCRPRLINWNWFNRGDSCDSCGTTVAAPCSSSVQYGSGVQYEGGANWTPRAANFAEGELVRPGPMEVVPRG